MSLSRYVARAWENESAMSFGRSALLRKRQFFIKDGEIRDTKTLNLSRNIVSLQVLVDVSRFSPCLIILTRNKNICCRLKKCGTLIGWFVGHEQICYTTSYEFDEKRATKPKFVAQSRPALYFLQLSSTRNKCFCCATSWSRKVKNRKHRQKLATKQCFATSWGFLYLVFRCLNRQ